MLLGCHYLLFSFLELSKKTVTCRHAFTLVRSAIYSHGFKLWISLYFVTFYILAVIVMCNLLIALIVVSVDVVVVVGERGGHAARDDCGCVNDDGMDDHCDWFADA